MVFKMGQIMKILVSSGLGRLHLDKVASLLKINTNFEVTFITGAIPNKFMASIFFGIFGKLIYGRKNIHKSINLRIPKGFEREEVISLYIPDIVLFFGLILNKLHLVSINKVYSTAYFIFGFLSSFRIKDFDAIYIRAGAGSKIINKAKRLGKHVIVDHSSEHPNDIYNSLLQSKSKNALVGFQQRKNLWKMVVNDINDSNIVVVNAQQVVDSLINNGIPKNKIFLNHLPVDVKKIPCKVSYKINNQINIGYSGMFIPRKGCDTLLKVIENLSYTYKNIKLNIYGIVEPHYYRNQLFIKLKQSKHLVEHGHLDQANLFECLKEMDVYTFLSHSEGSAQSVKEAMAIGLPVICTESTGAPIQNNVNGIICKADLNSCCDSLIFLLENEKQRLRLGSSARLEISDNHNNLKFTSILQKLINKQY